MSSQKKANLETIIDEDWRYWKPSTIGIKSDCNAFGNPTTIFRTPVSLIKECQNAYDAGLLIAASTLVVIVPDVCANIVNSEQTSSSRSDKPNQMKVRERYVKWCDEYLFEREDDEGVATSSVEMLDNHIKAAISSDELYRLRCALVHSENHFISQKKTVAHPFSSIGLAATNNCSTLVCGFNSSWFGDDTFKNPNFSDIFYYCSIDLEALIKLMTLGVEKFIREKPSRDKENEDSNRFSASSIGIVDFRPIQTSEPEDFNLSDSFGE